MSRELVRKNFQWPQEFVGRLARSRLEWHLEDPSRLKGGTPIVSETAYAQALITLALEMIDDPAKSERLWEILQKQRRSSKIAGGK